MDSSCDYTTASLSTARLLNDGLIRGLQLMASNPCRLLIEDFSLHLTAHEVRLVSKSTRESARYLRYHALLRLDYLDFLGQDIFLLILLIATFVTF